MLMKKQEEKELGIAVIGIGNSPGRAHLVDLQKLDNPEIPIEETIKEIPEEIQFYVPPRIILLSFQ
jgi:hypothetical protein